MKLACKDINPTTTCDFSVEGETASDVAAKMLVHAKESHAEDIAGKPDADVLKMFESKAHA